MRPTVDSVLNFLLIICIHKRSLALIQYVYIFKTICFILKNHVLFREDTVIVCIWEESILGTHVCLWYLGQIVVILLELTGLEQKSIRKCLPHAALELEVSLCEPGSHCFPLGFYCLTFTVSLTPC